jgi:GntR family transcriptional repressor for pyruvate dehydrogenase complex
MGKDILFEGIKTQRIYEKIVGQIKTLIQDGKLGPGDRLPGERELAETLGCSRSSVREAFRVLESEGLITTKHGEGRFIQLINQNVELQYRFSTVDKLEKSAILYFIEAREALEPKIAELAALRETPAAIEKMKQVLIKMADQLKKPLEKVENDSAFHIAMAEATQNFVFVSMMETNLNMVRQVRKNTLVSKERYKASLQEHQAILEAIKAKDPKKAVAETQRHLGKLKDNVLAAEKNQ